MEPALDALRKAICTPGQTADLGPTELRDFAADCVVALTAGGLGSRLQSVTEPQAIHKTILRLPNGETMIERTIGMYREAGFRDFVALVFHQAHSIVESLGDGSRLGVRVTYSHDPAVPVGRGGAIRHALDRGAIPRTKSLIVHNPDDVIVRHAERFPRDIVAAHLAGMRQGAIATAVVVEGARTAYTGFGIRNGMVEEVAPYPLVPIPAHVGVTVCSPAIYAYFDRLFSATEKSDFEGVLFPILAGERRLYSAIVPDDCWLAVNDAKALGRLIDLIEAEPAPAARPARLGGNV